MQERQGTIDRNTYRLARKLHGVRHSESRGVRRHLSLPEAQKDRFMLKSTWIYRNRRTNLLWRNACLTAEAPESVLERGAVQSVISEQDLARLRAALTEVLIRPELECLSGGNRAREPAPRECPVWRRAASHPIAHLSEQSPPPRSMAEILSLRMTSGYSLKACWNTVWSYDPSSRLKGPMLAR